MKKLTIIGCGSIGASLAYKLMKSGYKELLLIDSEELSIDNINRHLLGIEYIGKNKAIALKDFLEKQYIDIKIKAISCKVEERLDEITKSDLIISALGDDAPIIEEKLMKDSLYNRAPPLISCWLEANAVSGHAVIFDKNSYLQQEGFILNDLSNSLAILKPEFSNTLLKDDVGCNSTYMPYSFIRADQHINHFVSMIINYTLDNNIDKFLTSIGNINEIRENLKEKDIRDNIVLKRKKI